MAKAVDTLGAPSSWITPLLELVGRESSWNPAAKNGSSTASGLFQFLDSTRKNYGWKGIDWSNPLHQAMAGIQYVKDRYGTPQKALEHWDNNKWY